MKKLLLFPTLKILSLFKYQGFPLYFLPDGGMGSHKRYLKFVIDTLSIDVPLIVEAGSGFHSTGLLVKHLKKTSYRLLSFDNHQNWHKKMSKKYSNPNSKFIFINGKSYFEIDDYLKEQSIEKIDLTFIDSSPFDSRTEVINIVKEISNIICVHDSDYFPHNNLWGEEDSEIMYKPKNKFFYGKLKRENLGIRNYDSVFKYWVEIYPLKPGHFTGPPLLVASNIQDVRKLFEKNKPKGIYFFSK
jgi:hypothetical protein